MSDEKEDQPIARRPALWDIIQRQNEILESLSNNPLLKEINERTIYISESSFFLIELMKRLAEHGVVVDEVKETLAMSLARDFVNDKLIFAKASYEETQKVRKVPKGIIDV